MIFRMAPEISFDSFIQTSDIHIGECRALEGYINRHKSVLEQVLDEAEKSKLLLVPGDLFHRKDTRHDEFMLAKWFILECERRKIYSVFTSGNHDHLEGKKTQLDQLNGFPCKYVKIVGWEPEAISVGNLGIICIPWRDYTTKQIEEVTNSLLPVISDMEYKIVMLHEFIGGSIMDNGKIIPKGTKIPSVLGVDYWAVGDVHKYQMTNVTNAWYAGAPVQFKFDDGLEKGFLKVSPPFQEKPEFIRTSFKKLLKINSTEEMTEDAYYYVQGDISEVLKGNDDERVIRSEWIKPEARSIDIEQVGITEGLADFLANKGVDQELQQEGIEWVEQILKTS